MENTILYENHLEETGEILSLEEFLLMEKRYTGKMRKFESYWDAMKRYGIVGLAAYITGAGAVSTTGGLVSVPISLVLYAGYRKYTDKCTEGCMESKRYKLCKLKCYLAATRPIIKQVYKEINLVKKHKIPTKTKQRVLDRLDKELVKWVQRYNKYEKEISEYFEEEKEDKKEHKKLTNAARKRYYGGLVI